MKHMNLSKKNKLIQTLTRCLNVLKILFFCAIGVLIIGGAGVLFNFKSGPMNKIEAQTVSIFSYITVWALNILVILLAALIIIALARKFLKSKI